MLNRCLISCCATQKDNGNSTVLGSQRVIRKRFRVSESRETFDPIVIQPQSHHQPSCRVGPVGAELPIAVGGARREGQGVGMADHGNIIGHAVEDRDGHFEKDSEDIRCIRARTIEERRAVGVRKLR